ncbi:hypothetical protein V1264_011691 [Littorina saxatilis]|uniref:Uncharacterized protein n=2 Tax=Littorina saxatilis TaxID=31220 RepID=A0AAN9BVI2_9CAEN
MNFFQEFHRAFLGGFTAILCEYLVPNNQVPSGVRSFFYGMTGTCAGILVILGTPLVSRLGYFHVIRYNFTWKVVGGIVMYLFIGSSNPWLIMLFILVDTTFTGGTAGFFNMPVSDICDEDMEKYDRRHPITSTVFGSNALVTKPAQSLCPMLVVSILNRYGYEEVKHGSASPAEINELESVMFQLICFFPVILGVMQYIAWSQFTIRRRILERYVPEEPI